MKTLFVFLLGGLVTGCGAPEQELMTPMGQGGSRLMYRGVQAEGGAERFLHFVDQQTQEPCRMRFETTDDKTLAYCLPAQTANLVYLDANCTKAAVQTGASGHKWVTAADYHGVGEARGFKLGARLPTQEAVYFTFGNSDCMEWGVSSAAQPLYEIAEERELSDFLRGELQTDKLSDQLTSTTFVGDDGSRLLWSLSDVRSQLNCHPGSTDAGSRCIPQYDPTPIIHKGLLSDDCEDIYVADYNVSRMAPLGTANGETYLATPLERETGVSITGHGACIPLNNFQLGRMTLYELQPYPAADWPALMIEDGGTGTVRTIEATVQGRHATPEGEQILLQMFHTGREDIRCGPSWVDDTLRCVPDVGEFEKWFFEVYVDSRCSTRGVSVEAGMPPPELARIHVGVAEPTKGSLPVVQLFRVGPQSESVGYVKNGETCTARTLGDVYTLGERVDSSAFEPLNLIDRTIQ